MQDVRNFLGLKSVRWKTEERVLDIIGRVVHIGYEK